MASLDVDSLFTNILLDAIINICIDNLCNFNESPTKIAKHDFRILLSHQRIIFTFNNKYHKKVDDAPMGSPLGLIFGFICSRILENRCLFENIRYVDEIFVLFSSLGHVGKFNEYFLSTQSSINFFLEREEDGFLSFLDVKFFESTRNSELTSFKKDLQLDTYQLQTLFCHRHIKLI